MPAFVRLALVPLLLLGATATAPETANAPPGVEALPLERARLGTGWVVWESNRSGAFRIWGRSFAGEPAHRLSPEEPGRDHCCARISPDGERVVYLSLPGGARSYLEPSTRGELHLLDLADGSDRVLSSSAHHYGEHRAAEWWSATVLVYLDVDGTTRRLDLTRATSRVLARSTRGSPGWLVDPSGRHAAGGATGFGERDAGDGDVHAVTPLGGCQHEITADGEFGFWAAGAGGPIDVVDLATWTTRTLLRKNDPRLPADRGYLYFPMLSRDRGLLAYAASGGDHDHFRADYDVFLIEVDAVELSIRGDPIRVSRDPAVDRFPDVWRLAPPLESTRPRRAPSASPPAADAPAFLWNDADDLNRRAPGAPSEILAPHGAAWTDRRGRLALAGGYFAADQATGIRIRDAVRESNALTLSLLVEPASLAGAADGPLVALTNSPRQRSFVLRQSGRRIELVLRTAERGGPSGGEPIEIARLPDASPHHLVVRYSPGRLASFLDGRPASRRPFPGDFFHWRGQVLLAGAEANDATRFHGSLSRIAIWARELTDDEIAALATSARETLSGDAVPRVRVEARLLTRSRPATLAEISPYRRALVLERWELVRTLDGSAPPRFFRLARWALLDAEPVSGSTRPPGAIATLTLEPYARQPQLESVVLADDLPPAAGEPIYFDVDLSAP